MTDSRTSGNVSVTSGIERPSHSCLFYSKEKTRVESEVLNEYDDMEIVVCESTRDVVVETRTSRAKLCHEHAEHCVATGKWEFVKDDGNGEEPIQTTLATDGGQIECEKGVIGRAPKCGICGNVGPHGLQVRSEDAGEFIDVNLCDEHLEEIEGDVAEMVSDE